jgi:sterol desaturase/sphingolipid hydroxylase (fatty acid hydroxylase superfamily)
MWPSESDWLQWGSAYWAYAVLFVFGVVAWAEAVRPRRRLMHELVPRWTRHTVLWLVNIGFSFVILPTSEFAVALHVADSPFGLLNHQSIPFAARFVLAVVLLDLVRYAAHRVYHRLTLLWWIHQAHHSDTDFDVSTGFRFHPAEVVLSNLLYLGIIALLAPPPLAVLCVAFLTMAQDLLEHSNVAIPERVDRALRFVLVTPDMHRIHHSDVFSEQNANFGTIFTWWDRMFGTYQSSPSFPHSTMGLGLDSIPDGGKLGILAMLAIPFHAFRRQTGAFLIPARSPKASKTGYVEIKADLK